MGAILQVEHTSGLLSVRRSILEPLGYDVISVLGFSGALDRSLLRQPIGVIVIGHGTSRSDRHALISHFREVLPCVPIVVLLGKRDIEFNGADYNCPGDNPPLWIRTVRRALTGGRQDSSSSRPQ